MLYFTLQNDIDQAFVEINKIVATALAGASSSGLGKFSAHSVDVLGVYDPAFDTVDLLDASDCKNNAILLLQNTVTYSGYSSGSCFKEYNGAVQAEADAANAILNGFNGQYGQVVLNVYKSYVGNNAMVDSEIIEQNINKTYAAIAQNWDNSRPAVDELKASLELSITNSGGVLDTCFTGSKSYASAMIDLTLAQISACQRFDANNRSNSRGSRSAANQWKSYTEEFEALVASHNV